MKKILDKYTDKEILDKFVEIYPDQKKTGYKRVLKHLRKLKPRKGDDTTLYPSKFRTYGLKPNDEQRYAVEFDNWQEWLGYKVKTKKHGLTALCYCLWEMTYMGFDQRGIQNTLKGLVKRVASIKISLPPKSK